MKDRGIHEDCIAQIDRLYRERLYAGAPLQLDEAGRIRLDELEMGQAVQAEVDSRIQRVTSDNLMELADVEGFRLDFLRAHGFEVEGVDYCAEVSPLGLPLRQSRHGAGKRGSGIVPTPGKNSSRALDGSASLPSGLV
jgi:enoyl-[acyl-carrier protein] reductase/trans-2-enoyl-CoA reductase (NAD+)